jgi:hypothetical protein
MTLTIPAAREVREHLKLIMEARMRDERSELARERDAAREAFAAVLEKAAEPMGTPRAVRSLSWRSSRVPSLLRSGCGTSRARDAWPR